MNLWNSIRYIFSRPILAAGVVGCSIHLLMAMNQDLLLGISYWSNLSGYILKQPVYGALQVLIPFLVPYLVTLVGRKLRIETEITSLQKFPHANPNLILKLDDSSQVQFMNRATEALLNEMGLELAAAQTLIPEDTQQIITEIIGTDRTVTRKMNIGKCVYEYRFRAFTDERTVFLSGQNITQQLAMETELQDSYHHLAELSDFADRTFRQFDPLSFDVHHHYQAIMNLLLREKNEEHYDKPTSLFFAFRQADGGLAGHIFTKRDGRIIQDEDEIIVDPQHSAVAITYGNDQVVWSNWDAEKESLDEFQAHFHEKVKAKLGPIEAYATYNNNEVALIGFYNNRKVNQFDAQALKTLTIYAKSLKIISDQAQATEAAFIYAIMALARAAEANDEDTGQHIVRVNEYSKRIAESLGLDADFVRKIHYTAQMHDVGKVHIPSRILRKPGQLTEEEFAEMAQHPEIGVRILGDSPQLAMARDIALGHHEKYDGTGYPNGRKGDEIPLAARIVTIADVYDALRQKRSYKPSYSHAKALNIITQGDGRVSPDQFDPVVLEAFSRIADQIEEIYKTHQD